MVDRKFRVNLSLVNRADENEKRGNQLYCPENEKGSGLLS